MTDDDKGTEESFADFETKVMSGEADEPADETKEVLELGGEDAPEVKQETDETRTRSRPWQKRVDVLTARLRDAERRAAEAEGQRSATVEELKEPDEAQYEFGGADPNYIKDAAIFAVKKQIADERKVESDKSAEHAAKAEAIARIDEGMAKVETGGAEKYADFDEKIAAAIDARGGESLPPLVGLGIAISPVGADIAYRLATDNDVSERIEAAAKSGDQVKAAQMFGEIEGEFTDGIDDLDLSDPLDMARAFGRMSALMKGNGGKGSAVERKVTKAPKPAEHRARGGTGQFEVSDDTDDFSAFEKKVMGRSR